MTADYEIVDGVPQLQHWSVCQVCGDVAPRGTIDWIDAPRRLKKTRRTRTVEPDGSGMRIVRCPRHWSEWALRNSIGRTNANRRRMLELREQHRHDMYNPAIGPFPLKDLPVGEVPSSHIPFERR